MSQLMLQEYNAKLVEYSFDMIEIMFTMKMGRL